MRLLADGLGGVGLHVMGDWGVRGHGRGLGGHRSGRHHPVGGHGGSGGHVGVGLTVGYHEPLHL